MKISKLLSWIGQLFAFIFNAITGAKNDLMAAITEATSQNMGATNAAAERVQISITNSQSAVTQTVAQAGSNVIQAVNERSGETAAALELVNQKLEVLVSTESEDELRKALEQHIPEDLRKDFKW